LDSPQKCPSGDNCASTWLNNFLSALKKGGNLNAIEGVAFHAYPEDGETAEQVTQQASLMQDTINTYYPQEGSMPLIDTESSWGLDTQLPAQDDQIAFVARHLLLEQSIGIQNSVWYAYDNADWGTMWTSAGGANAVATAYQQVAAWTTGAQLMTPCTPDGTSGIYTCSYTRPGGYTATAVWIPSGTSTYNVPAGYLYMQDLSGNVEPVSGSSVTIGTTPILFEIKPIPSGT
jgi:hypothetical protein